MFESPPPQNTRISPPSTQPPSAAVPHFFRDILQEVTQQLVPVIDKINLQLPGP